MGDCAEMKHKVIVVNMVVEGCAVWRAVPSRLGSRNKRLVSLEMGTGVLSVKKRPRASTHTHMHIQTHACHGTAKQTKPPRRTCHLNITCSKQNGF